jgi:hypothetical protein
MRLRAVVTTGLAALTLSRAKMQNLSLSSVPGAAYFRAWISSRKIDAAV